MQTITIKVNGPGGYIYEHPREKVLGRPKRIFIPKGVKTEVLLTDKLKKDLETLRFNKGKVSVPLLQEVKEKATPAPKSPGTSKPPEKKPAKGD